MANILSLKHRIKAAQNVSKTTKALQMISAAKMKKAQEAVLSARPYVSKLNEMAGIIKSSTRINYSHPYLKSNITIDKTLLLVISPDKGLCGSLITNLIREFINYNASASEVSYVVIGKKLETRVTKLNREIIAAFSFGSTLPQFYMIYPLVKIIDEYYLTGKVDSVKILMTDYGGVFSQTPKIIDLLPIKDFNVEKQEILNQYTIYEPEGESILYSLLKHYLEMSLYLSLIESFVSEQASRMISMQNATQNAFDIMDTLKLEYNKTRQTKITNEILDMRSPASASENI